MAIQILFSALMGTSLIYGLIRGMGEEITLSMLAAARDGVGAALSMAGGFAFFCGLIAIPKRAGAVGALARWVSPLLRRLMGTELPGDALEYVTLNLTANLLGLGNAATPMGVEAARRMAAGGEAASDALCLFLVINASSVQLLPSTVVSLRAAAGSAAPGAIVGPTILATGISTLVGILSCKLAERKA